MSIIRRKNAVINKTLFYNNQLTTLFKPVNGIVPELMSESSPPPVGSITAYTVSKAPEGWLICDGSEVSRKNFSSLFSVIGIRNHKKMYVFYI